MNQTVRLMRVLPESLPMGWEVVEPMLQPAIDRSNGECPAQFVYDKIAEEVMQLWVAVGEHDSILGAMVTQLTTHSDLMTCELLLLGGTGFDDWSNLWPEIEDWALLNGCLRVKAFVRPGFVKKAVLYGFSETHRVIIKDLRGKLQ